MRVRVLIRPKEGILDPQGQAVERALPALGYEDVSNVHVGRLVELDVDGNGDVEAQVLEMCERLLANPLIESYEVQALGRDRMSARVGVVVFPGSCDEADAFLAAERAGLEPQYLWHADRDLQGVDGVIVPGGFSYGDYLRVGRDRAFLRR